MQKSVNVIITKIEKASDNGRSEKLLPLESNFLTEEQESYIIWRLNKILRSSDLYDSYIIKGFILKVKSRDLSDDDISKINKLMELKLKFRLFGA